MFETQQIILLKRKARIKKHSKEYGFIFSFERDDKTIKMISFIKPSEESYFKITQDGFCNNADRCAKKVRLEWEVEKLKVVMATAFKDDRLTREFESLFFHWWASNRDIMLGDFEVVRA